MGVKVKGRGRGGQGEQKKTQRRRRRRRNLETHLTQHPFLLSFLLSCYLFSLEQCQGKHRATSRGTQTICSPPLARSQKSSYSFPNEFYFRLLELGKEVKYHCTFLSYIIAFKILRNSSCAILALSHVHV